MYNLAVAILLPVLAGGLVGYLTRKTSKPNYQATDLPDWAPPAWLFGVVWPMLYVLMGMASWFIWKSEAETSTKVVALSLYMAQLAFNLSWSFVYFKLDSREWALSVIAVIDILVAIMFFYFYSINPVAGLLLLPYVAWLGFATALNFEIVRR